MFQKIYTRLNVEHFIILAIALALLFTYCENRIGNVHTVFLDLDKTLIQNRQNIEKGNRKLFYFIRKQRTAYLNPITLSAYQDAKKAMERCNTLNEHLDSVRIHLIQFVEGNSSATRMVHFEEQTKVRRFFESQYHLNTLAEKINQLQDSLLVQIKDQKDRAELAKQFQLHRYKKDMFSPKSSLVVHNQTAH